MSEADSKALLAPLGRALRPRAPGRRRRRGRRGRRERGRTAGRGEAVRRADRPQDRAGPGPARPRRSPTRSRPPRRSCSTPRCPRTRRPECWWRRWSSGSRELIAGVCPRRAVRPDRAGGHRRRARRGGRRRGDPPRARSPRSTPRRCSTSCRPRRCSSEFRGEPAVDRAAVVQRAAGAVRRCRRGGGQRRARRGGRPQPVDHQRRTSDRGRRTGRGRCRRRGVGMSPTPEQFAALFDPRGIVIAGASTHPGKFGFVSLHNVLANGYQGRVFATNLEGSPVLGIDTLRSLDELPEGGADLIFVCTPKSANPDLLRTAAAKGVRAAFLTSAGYGEAGRAGPCGRGRAGRALRRAGHPARRPERTGCRVHPRVAVRADRRAVPAGGPHRRRQPVRQLRVQLHELVLRHGRRHLPRGVRRQRCRDRRRRLPDALRGRPPHRGGARLRRGDPGRPGVLRPR